MPPERRRRRIVPGSVLLLLLTGTGPLGAQADSATAIAGSQYAAGNLHRWLLGDGYRRLWTTPMRVPYLDLDTTAGGLTAVERGGNVQTLAIRFRGKDGQEYNFRSVDKELTPALPPFAQETVLDWVRQDVTSAQMPLAPLVATPLLDAVGLLNPAPRLFVLPDHPALGEFREEFAGMLGTFEYHASEIEEGVGGFAGSIEVKGTEGMLDDVEDDPMNRVDARAFLTARLVDLVIGDWDRHEGQWRWARFDRDGTRWWVPVPEDRDYAFVDYGGVLVDAARRIALPRLVGFGEDYASLRAMMSNSEELNRRLLAGLPESAWDSVAIEVENRLSDAVIADAAGRLPPEMQGSSERIASTLRARRDRLRGVAREYYRLLAGYVEIHSTDVDERAAVERRADGSVEVVINTPEGLQVYQRIFDPDHTKELRIHLHGGDDIAVVRGAGSSMAIRILGGGDDDRLEDVGRGPTVLYDSEGENQLIAGADTRVDRQAYEPPEVPDGLLPDDSRDSGASFSVFPLADWRSHVGPVVGAGFGWTHYAFRHDPLRDEHRFSAIVAPLDGRLALEYDAQLRRENSARWIEIRGQASTLNAMRFNGFGNETESAGDAARVWLRELIFEPRWHLPVSASAEFASGFVVKYTDPSFADNAPVAGLRPFGSDPLGQVQAIAAFTMDSRDDRWFPRRGIDLEVTATGAPPIWNLDAAYGRLEASTATYVSLPVWTEPVMALRAGGARVWGEFPFQEAAYLGGSSTLRGFERERFVGDAMLFGNAELRLPLAEVELLVRGDLGISGLMDAGRVYVEGDSPGGWHHSAGGSLWFATPALSVSLTYAHGEDDGFYADFGLPF